MPCPHWGQSLPLLPPRGASLMSCKQVGQLHGLRLMLHSFRGRRLLFARSYMKEFLIRFFAPLMYPASIRGLNSTLLSDGALTILTVDKDVFSHAGAFKDLRKASSLLAWAFVGYARHGVPKHPALPVFAITGHPLHFFSYSTPST